MHITHFEIKNFRKLKSVRIDIAEKTTLFVGANNSGKTSAMLVLRHFLVEHDNFSINDFTLSGWPLINDIGANWLANRKESSDMEDTAAWDAILPFLDVWLHINDDELHYVSKLIPSLDWAGGLLGVRLRFEPKSYGDLRKEYISAVDDVAATMAELKGENKDTTDSLKLWPENLLAFLERKLGSHFTIRTYPLDPEQSVPPQNGQAVPQNLPSNFEPVEGNPLFGLIRVDEINAQRGLGRSGGEPGLLESSGARDLRRLSDQLRRYYADHLDPFDRPGLADLGALSAIKNAQEAFDERLGECFESALSEVQDLGYPGVTDPKIKISTRLRPIDGLDHDTAVQYEIDLVAGESSKAALHLPEHHNGLGYQNLISMIFRLMAFRDSWMRVGKARKSSTSVKPIHLVLIEEPEAHLHAQVQQVFIKRAYKILRGHPDLGQGSKLTTQLIVSTHSSHVAHETPFASLRYFRRLPAGMADRIPVSTVINLTEVFGGTGETEKFVVRYLRTQHCDLFFADAVVLVEGPAERMLVPHFIRIHFEYLSQCYITMLEIGGSHAHRLEPLIRHLGLLTLVITDIDAVSVTTGKSEVPVANAGQVTNNSTLKQWLPKLNVLDDLLNCAEEKKVAAADDLFAVRVAYQTPVEIQFKGNTANVAASTFEDALVFENADMFSSLKGDGLAKKFRKAVVDSSDHESLRQALFESLRTGKKAELALDVMEHADFESVKVPRYIGEGLQWLQIRLRRKQRDENAIPDDVVGAIS